MRGVAPALVAAGIVLALLLAAVFLTSQNTSTVPEENISVEMNEENNVIITHEINVPSPEVNVEENNMSAAECYADFECNTLNGERCIAGKCVPGKAYVTHVSLQLANNGQRISAVLCTEENATGEILPLSVVFSYTDTVDLWLRPGEKIAACECTFELVEAYHNASVLVAKECDNNREDFLLTGDEAIASPLCRVVYRGSTDDYYVFEVSETHEVAATANIPLDGEEKCSEVSFGTDIAAPLSEGDSWTLTVFDENGMLVHHVGGSVPEILEDNTEVVLYRLS